MAPQKSMVHRGGTCLIQIALAAHEPFSRLPSLVMLLRSSFARPTVSRQCDQPDSNCRIALSRRLLLPGDIIVGSTSIRLERNGDMVARPTS